MPKFQPTSPTTPTPKFYGPTLPTPPTSNFDTRHSRTHMTHATHVIQQTQFQGMVMTFANDESYHCVVRIGSPALISFYYVRFVSFYFFLSFYFFVDFTTCLGIDVSLSILQIKYWSCSQIPKWSLEGRVASALLSIIKITGLVQFREKSSYVLPPHASLELLAAECLRETNIPNCIYYLLMITCSLDALKRPSRRKDMRIKRKKSNC